MGVNNSNNQDNNQDNNNSNLVLKWFLGIIGAVITPVLIYHLTKPPIPDPTPNLIPTNVINNTGTLILGTGNTLNTPISPSQTEKTPTSEPKQPPDTFYPHLPVMNKPVEEKGGFCCNSKKEHICPSTDLMVIGTACFCSDGNHSGSICK